MKTPTITTERLLLRPLTLDDAEFFYSKIGSDIEVQKYMLWNLHESIDDTIEWLKEEESKLENDDYYDWAIVIKENNKLIGSGGLIYNENGGLFEVGYDIMKEEWGKGYVTEFVKRILDFATDELGQKEVLGRHVTANPASGRVMLKAGFEYVDDGECYSYDGNRCFDCKHYIYTKK